MIPVTIQQLINALFNTVDNLMVGSLDINGLAMGVNACCNYVLIFGKLGFPAMGVAGAAIGTLIARTAEMAFYLVILLRRKSLFTCNLAAIRRLKLAQLRTFARKAWPLISNEVLWSLGMNIFFWTYSTLSEASLPAITIGEQISQIAFVLATGTASAVSVLIGTELGANRLSQAKSNAKKLITLVLSIGLISAALCCVLAVALPAFFKVTPELQALSTRIAMIMGLLSPCNFLYGFCFFCIRAGGDTRTAMLLDSGYMWFAPVPAALLMALFLPGKISLTLAVFIIQMLMNGKVIWGLWALRKGKWVRNITVET